MDCRIQTEQELISLLFDVIENIHLPRVIQNYAICYYGAMTRISHAAYRTYHAAYRTYHVVYWTSHVAHGTSHIEYGTSHAFKLTIYEKRRNLYSFLWRNQAGKSSELEKWVKNDEQGSVYCEFMCFIYHFSPFYQK